MGKIGLWHFIPGNHTLNNKKEEQQKNVSNTLHRKTLTWQAQDQHSKDYNWLSNQYGCINYSHEFTSKCKIHCVFFISFCNYFQYYLFSMSRHYTNEINTNNRCHNGPKVQVIVYLADIRLTNAVCNMNNIPRELR